MVNHIVFWNLKPELTEEERAAAAVTMKKNLEAVGKLVEGVVSLEVKINKMDSSSRDLALFSKFTSAKALEAYQIHPEHQKALAFGKTVTCDRACFDFVE